MGNGVEGKQGPRVAGTGCRLVRKSCPSQQQTLLHPPPLQSPPGPTANVCRERSCWAISNHAVSAVDCADGERKQKGGMQLPTLSADSLSPAVSKRVMGMPPIVTPAITRTEPSRESI